jgi:hypothetical protein
MSGPTNFAESNALLALQSGDEAEARRLLADFFPGELGRLADAADKLSDLCGEYRTRDDHAKGEHKPGSIPGRCPLCAEVVASW